MKLFVARHGRTSYNVAKKFLGQANDPLDEMGLKQAEALADRLAKEALAAVVSSPLSRAFDTASAIASRHGLPVLEDPDLLEINMGEWEGRVQDDVKREAPEFFSHWLQDANCFYPAGGESLSAVRDRITQALHRWQEAYPTEVSGAEPTIVWVTHTVFIGVLMCHILGLPLQRRQNFHTDNVSLTEIHLVQRKHEVVPVLRGFNNIEHIRGRGLWKPSNSYLYIG